MILPEIRNRLLRAFDPADIKQLAPHLDLTTFAKGAVLYEPGQGIDTIYFPDNAVISLLTVMQSGEAIELATIGREGALGLVAARSPRRSLSRAIVQVPGDVWRIGIDELRPVWEESARIRDLCERHNEALFGHAIQSVACNALHSVEARFSRWLLCCHDRIDSDTVSLTQEFLADMLGVQRTTVTVVARALQAAGLIRYRRGIVDILDRPGLEALTCECYGAVRRNYERLLPQSFG